MLLASSCRSATPMRPNPRRSLVSDGRKQAHPKAPRMTAWCVLRTSSRKTLRIAEALEDRGLKAWTPREVRMIRIPRANVRRRVVLPMMPSFVFARSENLHELLHLSASEQEGLQFSVMHYADRIPLIADVQLNALRRIEARRNPRKRADRRFPPGIEVRVKIEGGSFAGMRGKVEKSDHGHTLVCFDNRLTVKIDTLLLSADEVETEQDHYGLAARKAA